LRVIGLGLSLLGLALGGAFLMPEVFYPGRPFPRGPHLSDMLGLGAAACFLLAVHRLLGRRMVRTGRLGLHLQPKPIGGWFQWAYHLDPLGQVIDD